MNRAKSSPGPRRAPRLWATFALASLALAPAQACVRQPAVTLHHAELRSASLYGVGMEVFLIVNNKNSYDIQIRNVRATVTLAGRYPVPLQASPNATLPSNRSTILPMPVTIPWGMVPGIVAASVGSMTVPYTVRGNADVTAFGFIDRDEYPIDEEGTVPRQFFVNATPALRF